MKVQIFLFVFLLGAIGTPQPLLFAQTSDVFSQLEGTWALTLPHNGRGSAGWLEVKQERDHIYASLLWYGGSVVPASHAYMDGHNLIVTHLRDRDGITVTSWIEVHLEKSGIAGIKYEPSRDGKSIERTTFTGVRLPADPPTPDLSSLKFGTPIKLLNDNNLDGWHLMGEDYVSGWMVKNGVLVNNPVQKDGAHHIRYGNIRTDAEFEDFNLKLDVNIPKENNSGIYLRGIYEIQVFDSYGKELDSHHMGGLYSRITPSVNAEKPAGEWQTFDITLVDRHVTVILNGKTIIDNQPVRGCTGGAITSNEFIPGPIYLQGDHGEVSYRNIVLTPIIK